MNEEVMINWEEQKVFAEKVKKIILDGRTDMPKAYVHSYGCQQNVADGEQIKGMLSLCGYGMCESIEDADIVIYNTCAVREHAETRVFGNVGALVHKKRKKPDMIIGLCGCMVQQPQVAEKVKKSYPFVDLIFGTHMLPTLPEILYNKLKSGKRVVDIRENKMPIIEGIDKIRDTEIRAFVPIMSGCDNFCTYCIVPYVRGREKSRKSADIIEECRELVKKGYKEIMLLGQNVNSYGKHLEENINFSELLRKINEIPGDFKIRFMTSHPKDATHELIDTMAQCEKVCHQLHLPVQSGSDDVLMRMNRRYTAESYLSLIDYARGKMPDISFSSDIIVGFPNETEEDFKKTMELVKRVKYDMLFTFIYSKRSGTPAARMSDSTPDEDKSRRLRELLKVQTDISDKNNKAKIGKTFTVLFDSPGKENGTVSGRTEGNIAVECKGSDDRIGTYAEVKIYDAHPSVLLGEIVK